MEFNDLAFEATRNIGAHPGLVRARAFAGSPVQGFLRKPSLIKSEFKLENYTLGYALTIHSFRPMVIR